jgi:hypothetical protein
MKTSELVEDQYYRLEDGKVYKYNGRDGGQKFVFVLKGAPGMRVYGKLTETIKTLPI